MAKKTTFEELERNHKLTEKALRDSLERFDLAVQGAQDGLWDLDVIKQVSYVSPRYEELLGYKPGEIKQPYEDWEARLHTGDRKRVLAELRAHLEKKVPYMVEYRLRTKSKGYRWFSARGQAIWNEDGQATRVAGSIRDITKRKKTEAALKESEEKYRNFSNGTFEAIILHYNGILIDANEQYYQMFGYKPEELAGKDAISLTTTPASFKFVKEQISSNHLGPYEVFGKKKDGTVFPIEIRAKTIKYKGKMARMAALRDLTKRRKAEEALQNAHDMLERKVKERTLQLKEANERLEKVNIGLQVLVEHRQEEIRKLKKKHGRKRKQTHHPLP